MPEGTGTSGGTVYVGIERDDADIARWEATFNARMQKFARKMGETFADEFTKSYGKQLGQELSSKVKSATTMANKAAAPLKVKVDSRDATAELDRIAKQKRAVSLRAELDQADAQRKLDALSKKIVEVKAQVEANTAGAEAELARLEDKRRLVQLDVEVKAAGAEAKLASLTRRETKTIEIRVDDNGTRSVLSSIDDIGTGAGRAGSSISGMTLAIAAIGPIGIPVLTAAAGAIAAIGVAAAGTGAAVGVAALAFHGISDAVSALGEESQAGAKKVAAANKEIASSVARAAAAASAQDTLKRAVQGVAQAQAALRNTTANANASNAAAARQVADAERGVADAQRDSKQAQLDLNAARRQAAQDIKDLNDRLRETSLNETEAKLAVERAAEELRKLQFDPRATDLDRREAKARYDRAVFNYEEEKKQTKDLQKQKADADKKGVEGSDGVKKAKQGVADATRKERDAERAVEEARRNQADTARKNAYAITQAQQSIVTAQQAVVAAQRAITVQAAQTKAATAATVPEVDKVAQAMAKLGPQGQKFAKYIAGLAPDFKEIKIAAEDALLPDVTKAIENLRPFKKQIKEFVTNVGNAVGDVVVKFSNALKNDPSFKRFFTYLSESVPRVIGTLGDIGISLGKIFADVFTAAGPAGESLLKDLSKFLDKISAWTSSKEGQKALADFFQKAIPNIKSIAKLFLAILNLVGTIATSEGFGNFIDGLTSIVNAMADFSAAHPKAVEAGLWAIFGALLAIKTLGPIGKGLSGLAKIGQGIGKLTGKGGGKRVAGRVGKAAKSGKVRGIGGKVGKGALKGGKALGKGGIVGIVVGTTAGFAGDKIQDGRGGARDAGGGALSGAATGAGIGGLIGSVIPGIGTVIGAAIGGLIGGIWGAWNAVGTEGVKGFFKGIGDKLGDFKDKANEWLEKHVNQPVRDFFGIKSPSKTFAVMGGQLIQGLKEGVWAKLVDWKNKISSWFRDNVFEPIKNYFGIGKAESKPLKLGRQILQAMKDGVWEKLVGWGSGIGKWFNDNMFQKIRDFFGIGTKNSKMLKLGRDLLSALISGFTQSSLFEKMKAPVKFLINTVMNAGLIGGFNWLTDKLKLRSVIPKIEPIQLPKGFKDGGHIRGPGSGTSDSIMARLSNGEFVVKEKVVKKPGVLGLLKRLNGGDIGGDPSGAWLPGFAGGGLVDSRIKRAQQWLPSVDPLPYIWGGVGPRGYDCSGLVGTIWAMLTGHHAPGQRYFTTSSDFSSLGFRRGTGAFTMGVNPGTHMAGNLAGLKFEAASTRSGIKIGPSARGVGTFAQQWYLPIAGDKFSGDAGGGGGGSTPGGDTNGIETKLTGGIGGIVKDIASLLDRMPPGGLMNDVGRGLMGRVTGKLKSLNPADIFGRLAKGGWNAVTGLAGRVGNGIANIGRRGRGWLGSLFDEGGVFPSGTVGMNLSGKPETVLTNQQWKDVRGNLDAKPQSVDRSIHITSDYKHLLRDLDHKRRTEELRERLIPR